MIPTFHPFVTSINKTIMMLKCIVHLLYARKSTKYDDSLTPSEEALPPFTE